jgi:nitrogen regulatory protein P-II 1
MTRIEAYIRTHLLENVREALEEIDVVGMTVTDVRGMGRSKGISQTYRGSQYTVNLKPYLKVEVLVHDDHVAMVVGAIQKAAGTGEIGDGKIVVLPVADVIRIRTGESGDIALT